MDFLAELRQHLRVVAAEYGVSLHYVDSWEVAESYPANMTAAVPRISRPRDFLVGMHEVGHCADPDARKHVDAADVYGILRCEGSAWAWAIHMIPGGLADRITAREWDTAAYCIRTHWRFQAIRHDKERTRRPPRPSLRVRYDPC